MQWFRGTLEASYVGTPNARHFLSPHGAGSHYQLQVYRAAVSDLTLQEPPQAVQIESGQPFRQARVDDARLLGIRGPGSHYHGPIFDLTVSNPTFTHLTYKDGRSYGKLVGTVQGWLTLPPEPQVELTIVTQPDGKPDPEPSSRLPAPAVITVLQPASAVGSPETPLDPELGPAPLSAAEQAAQALPRATPSREPSTLPLFALATAVSLGLWASCGGEPALLWVVFMLPTLLARKLFHDVLNDSVGIRGFGAFLVLVQLACVAVLLESWWSTDCKQMHVLPLIGLVAVIFPAGLLPSVWPLLCNAIGLALVLSVWCGGPSGKCHAAPERKPPSVQHPGVPRTNDDGSWPRRPPG